MSRRLIVPTVLAVTIALIGYATWRDAKQSPASLPAQSPAALASATIRSTARQELRDTVVQMEERLKVRPDDGEAVVHLAEALIRVQRVDSDAQAVIKAEQRLRVFLATNPLHYEAQRVLGSVLLSQHRFRDAIVEAERARAMDARDAWNYGVIGDAHLELGEYDNAFAAFDKMGALRPGPPAYARVAYALELKGDLEGAYASMRMAAEGTSAHDSEAQAWHFAQLGHLLLLRNRIGDARREFERAMFTFPDHPYAVTGLARVKVVEGDLPGALALYEGMFKTAPTPELAFVMGDLHARLGRAERAEALYVEGEELERSGWESEEPQPQALARFLAERGRDIPEAIKLAEEAAAKRRDVYTMDALAWAYYKGGRLDEARTASEAAIRTGTRDPRILHHAATIRRRLGDDSGARQLLERVSGPVAEVAITDPELIGPSATASREGPSP